MSATYNIATLGFSESEVAALNRILFLSLKRQRVYKIAEAGNTGPDLIVVNADIEEAVAKVETRVKDKSVVVYASKTPANLNFPNTLRLPFLGSMAIRTFDQIIIEKTGDIPEFNLSDDNTEYEVDKVSRASLEVGGFDAGQQKVLVLDDSSSVRKQMEIVLQANNLIPVMADTGEKALEVLENRHVDMAFLDVVLPGIDGYQVCKQIKRNKKFQHLPVVMLTSRSSPFDKVRGSLAGCDMYLTKPVSQEDSKKALQKCAEKMANGPSARFA